MHTDLIMHTKSKHNSNIGMNDDIMHFQGSTLYLDKHEEE